MHKNRMYIGLKNPDIQYLRIINPKNSSTESQPKWEKQFIFGLNSVLYGKRLFHFSADIRF